MRKFLTIGVAAGLLLGLAGAAPAQAGGYGHDGRGNGARPAYLSVFHGVPGLAVDVYVNGARTLDNFQPGSFAGPLTLPAGKYTVAITAADAVDASAPVIGPIDLTLAQGKNYTVAAHLTAAGAPTATLFTNDTRRVPRGQGRLTVRHIAAAPAVDVLAGPVAVISGLTNPNESALTLAAGTISVAVAAAGTTKPLIGPADINVAKRTNTIVYAWGSLAGGNLAVAVQTVTLRPAHAGKHREHAGQEHAGKEHAGKEYDGQERDSD